MSRGCVATSSVLDLISGDCRRWGPDPAREGSPQRWCFWPPVLHPAPPPRPELGPTAVGEMGGARGAAPELWSGASLHLWEGQEGQRGRTGPWTAEERPPGSLGWVASRRPGRRNRQWGLQGPRPEGQPVGPEGAGPGPEGAGAEGREGLPMGNKMTVPAPFSCSPVSQSRPHVPRAWRGGGAPPQDTPQSGGWSRGGRAWSLLLR